MHYKNNIFLLRQYLEENNKLAGKRIAPLFSATVYINSNACNLITYKGGSSLWISHYQNTKQTAGTSNYFRIVITKPHCFMQKLSDLVTKL